MDQSLEFSLHGSIIDRDTDEKDPIVPLLHDRLLGLCCNVAPQHLHEHELVFDSGGVAPVRLHVRRSIDKAAVVPQQPQSETCWLLRYAAQEDEPLSRQYGVLVRHSIDSLGRSNNLMEFLRYLGFRMKYELVMFGTVYHHGHIKITVAKLSKTEKRGDSSNTEPITESRVVTLSAIVPHGQETMISKEMKDFAEQLKPIVQLEKCDMIAAARR